MAFNYIRTNYLKSGFSKYGVDDKLLGGNISGSYNY
jgi:hypothetical protein